MDTLIKTPRFWQTRIRFKDGAEGTLTIQSEEGRSRGREDIFVLETIGAIRASAGWSFHFLGRAAEVPAFVPGPAETLFVNQVPYWLGTPEKSAPLSQVIGSASVRASIPAARPPHVLGVSPSA